MFSTPLLFPVALIVLIIPQETYGEIPTFRDDYEYVDGTRSFYKFHTTRRNWEEAVNVCNTETATLFYPRNKCETYTVLDFYSQTQNFGWAYIGISSLRNGTFETIDGVSIWQVYNNWRPGEPNNANGKENCVVLHRDGTLNDGHCLQDFPFICKKELNLSNSDALCDNQNVPFRLEYRYIEETGFLYKIHTISKTWQEAKEICGKEGASLFYPKNICENNAVLEFWNQTQPFKKVFVGVTSSAKGSFQTIDGHPVWDVYNSWHPGEPNNATGNENCVVLNRDGMFSDVICDQNFPFICSKLNETKKEKAICDKLKVDQKPVINFRKDYTFLEDTLNLYKIHTIFRSWQDAKQTCENEGATLFYPENDCEANTVLYFWNQTQPIDLIYIGVLNPTQEFTVINFETIDGRPVWEVYNNWQRGEPNNVNGEEGCVVLSREGTLRDDKCDKNYAFICKKKTNSTSKNAFCDKSDIRKRFRTDYQYIEDTQSFYKLHTSFKSWQAATNTCAKEGSILFYPENDCEVNAVINFWSRILPFRRIYIGISSPSKGIFETVEGLPLWKTYNNWRPGEPDNKNDNEGCVVLDRENGEFSDEYCGIKLPFVCKKKLILHRSVYACGKSKTITVDESGASFRNDYTFLEDTQSWYKIHLVINTWQNAHQICQKEGAKLLYPESSCEVRAITKFGIKAPSAIMGSAFLDISTTNKERIFETGDGRKGADLYYNWNTGEPNNSGGSENCVSIYYETGLYNDIGCDSKANFICKKKLVSSNRTAPCDIQVTEGGFRSDYKYINDTQSFYKFHKEARDWQDANTACAKEGATLFYPINKCEANAVLDFWGTVQPFGWILVGFSSQVEGIYKSVDGTPIWKVYNNWRPGEPNNQFGQENCVVLLQDGTLNDVQCGKAFPFMCRKKLNPKHSTALCDQTQKSEKSGFTFGQGYTYLGDTRSFYKFHTIQHGWEEAYRICMLDDAVLFYPENRCEANAVLELWNQTQPFSSIFVGIWRPTKESLETIDGRPAWEVYNDWLPGEPNNFDGNEDCVILTRNGLFSDVKCRLKFPFICKKKTDPSSEIAACEKFEITPEADLGFRRDYKYFQDTRSFYKIHTILRNWPAAKEACVKEGANLFYAENELEANVVLDFWKQTQPFNEVYIGAFNPTKESLSAASNFVTIDGRPINITYNKWYLGEPNNENGEEYCVILSRDGYLKDERCGKNYAFICKITISSVIETAIHGKPKTSEKQDLNFRKDYTYFEDTQSFYKFHTRFNNWNEAKQICIREGATLFYPENKCEADVVLAFWQKTQVFRRAFIGVSRSIKGNFETTDGTPIWLVYNKWLPGKPDIGDDTEACVALYRKGTIEDEQCKSKVPFICKKKIYSEKKSTCSKVPFSERELINKDYTYVEDTQSLYKVHTILQSWFDARKTCNSEGASLFYAENECEVNAVTRFWEQTQVAKWVFIGISSPVKGKFVTIDGRPIWYVYNKWRSSQPDNKGNAENCVTMYADGTFNDDMCVKKFAFICKKRMNSRTGVAVCDKPKKYTKEIIDYLKDYTYLEDVQNLYKIHTVLQSWEDAKKKCLEEGATYFYPENEQEFKSVQAFWKRTQIYNELFVGLSFSSNGTFQTFDGHPIKDLYNKWDPGKPTITNGCVLLRRKGAFDEADCTTEHAFICKKKHDLRKGNVADYNNRYSAAQRNRYKFYLTPKNWTDAFSTCGKEQSYLAVINSQEEADLLAMITKEAPKDKVSESYFAGVVYLGFYKQKDTTWRTITDQTLNEAGYEKWSYKQPDGGDRENCGSMFYNGDLNDLGCFNKCFFICERNFYNSNVTMRLT